MYVSVVVLLVSCLTCLAVTPLVRSAARRLGLVDRPDRVRKLHARPTPVAGGLAILTSTVAAVVLCLGVPGLLPTEVAEQAGQFVGLLLAAVFICGVGVVDDYLGLSGRYKLIGQLMAAAIVVQSGLVVHELHVFGWRIDLGFTAIPFTLLWLLGSINALNLIDGMDGLLSSIGLIIAVAIAVMAALGGHLAEAAVAAALAGALLAFLRYNYPPASIFLGDSGSMLIGLVVGTLAIRCSLKGPAAVTLSVPVVILAVPFFDTLMAIVRRKLTGRSIYATDRGHLHHVLLHRGLTKPRALLVICSCCALTVTAAMTSLVLNNELLAVGVAVTVVGMLITTKLFGYTEFLLLKERIRSATTGRLARPGTDGQQIAVRLQGSLEWQKLWNRLVSSAPELELEELHLNINIPALHEGYYARWRQGGRRDGRHPAWRFEMPLSSQGTPIGSLRLAGKCENHSYPDKIAAVSQLIAESPVLASVAWYTNAGAGVASADDAETVIDARYEQRSAGRVEVPVGA
jgi:UDP-GlcNAc:undecaprenyl-phosphate GlcNAc-1-phosphate transferase